MDILSIVAAVCSTSASLPQFFSHGKLNVFSMVLRGIGGLAWATYAMLKAEWALFASSIVVTIIESILYIKHRRALGPTEPDDTGSAPIGVEGNGSSLEIM